MMVKEPRSNTSMTKVECQDFVEFVDATDPDVLLAWGMGFYDLPTLYRRLESTGRWRTQALFPQAWEKKANEASTIQRCSI